MKVLLIAPTYQYKHHYPSFIPFLLFPTGFAYLASALKAAGHEVVGLNLNNIIGYSSARDMIQDNITQAIRREKPGLVGLGGLCIDYAFIKDAIRIIRDTEPYTPIVLGGGIINNDAEFVFNMLRPDFCIIGEGEEVIIQLINALESNNYNYGVIPNMGYWDNTIAKFTSKDFNYGNIDSRPFPDYEPFGVQNIDDYTMTSSWWYRYTRPNPRPWAMITARSCPFSCTFCVHDRGPKYRARSIENVMQEIKLSYEKYHFNVLIMMDELFAVNKARMREFCLALNEGKRAYGWDFSWAFQAHASANLDKDTLELAKLAGCSYFGYGLESASPIVLKSMNKKTRISQITEAIRLADETGIGYGGNLIFGDPAETEDTVLESIDFMVKHCLDINVILAALRPYPGSKVFDICMEKGIIKDKLEFYEHIDENPWNMTVNMTAIPNKKWLPLLDSIVAFGQLFPWVKPVVPYCYELDTDARNSPAVLNTGKQVYKIWAACPHCGKGIYCRELLAPEKGLPSATVKEYNILLADKIIALAGLFKDAIVKALRLSILYYLSFSHPVYRLLKSSVRTQHDLFWDSFFGTVWFVSGCPNCNKVIKITIPIPFTIKALSFTEIKRRFKLA